MQSSLPLAFLPTWKHLLLPSDMYNTYMEVRDKQPSHAQMQLTNKSAIHKCIKSLTIMVARIQVEGIGEQLRSTPPKFQWIGHTSLLVERCSSCPVWKPSCKTKLCPAACNMVDQTPHKIANKNPKCSSSRGFLQYSDICQTTNHHPYKWFLKP
jgi:hypothetical protein